MPTQKIHQVKGLETLRQAQGVSERERELALGVNPLSRIGEGWGEVFSFQNLLLAYYSCRRTKRRSRSAAEFEINFEKWLNS